MNIKIMNKIRYKIISLKLIRQLLMNQMINNKKMNKYIKKKARK